MTTSKSSSAQCVMNTHRVEAIKFRDYLAFKAPRYIWTWLGCSPVEKAQFVGVSIEHDLKGTT